MSPPTVKVTKIVDISPDVVYRIAVDVERYTEFVPGIRSACITEDVNGQKIVEMELCRGSFSVHLQSVVTLDEGRSVTIVEPDGPLKGTRMVWLFIPLEDGNKTEVTFEADFKLPGSLLSSLNSIITGVYAREIVDAFIRRTYDVTKKS